MNFAKDVVIVMPTHNRHSYLVGKIDYYSNFPCQVFICDSSANKMEWTNMPDNIHYFWWPEKSFHQKVFQLIQEVPSKYYAFSADDDFIVLSTLEECYNKMEQDERINISIGKQAQFNKPYDGRFFSKKTENMMRGRNFSNDRIKNSKLYGTYFQDELWSLYRREFAYEAFKKLAEVNPANGNFMEIVIAFDLCLKGGLYISPNIMNYREFSNDYHWAKVVPGICPQSWNNDPTLKSDVDAFLNYYFGEDRKVVNCFLKSYINAHFPTGFFRRGLRFFKSKVRKMSNYSNITEEPFVEEIDNILKTQCK